MSEVRARFQIPAHHDAESAVRLVNELLLECGWHPADAPFLTVDTLPVPASAPVGRSSPATSREAAVAVGPRAHSTNRRILRFLVSRRVLGASDLGGATAAEIADTFHKTRPYIASRLWELRRSGWVEPLVGEDGSAVTRPTGESTHGMVQIATEAAVGLDLNDNDPED